MAPPVAAAPSGPQAPLTAGTGLPLAERLRESWRWRELRRRLDDDSFRSAHVTERGWLLLTDDEGLWAYDGLDFVRVTAPTGEGLGDVKVIGTLPDGVLLHCPGRVVLAPWSSPDRPAGASGEEPLLVLPRNAHGLEALHLTKGPAPAYALAGPGPPTWITMDGRAEPVAEAPPGHRVHSLGVDARGHHWAASDAGLWRRVEGPWEQVPLPVEEAKELRRGLATREGHLLVPWALDHRHPLVLCRDGVPTPLPALPGSGVVSDVMAGPDGELVVALHGSALWVLHDGAWSRAAIPLPHREAVASLALLGSGRMAVITQTGRLLLCELLSQRWRTVQPPAEVGGMVNALAHSRRGGLWLGTHLAIARWDGSTFQDIHDEGAGLALGPVTALHEDEAGDLWVGSGSRFTGVLRLAEDGWQHHQEPEGVGTHHVHAIRRGPDGALWFLLLSPDGERWQEGAVARLKDGSWTRWDQNSGSIVRRTYDVAFDAEGRPWFGMWGGLGRFEDGQLVPQTVPALGAWEPAFSLVFDRQEHLWVGRGFNDLGVLRLRADEGGWSVAEACSLPNSSAAAFAMTDDGSIWFTSEQGLRRAFPGKRLCVDIDPRGALESAGFWPVLPDRDGHSLWLGSRGSGLVRYTPDDQLAPRNDGRIEVLTPADVPRDSVVLRWSGRDPWGDTPPDALRWQLRLDDGPWSPWTRPGQLSQRLDGLEPGEHVVELRCADSAGNVEPVPAQATFRVRLPLWRQPPMLAASSLAVTALAALALAIARGRRRGRQHARRLATMNQQLHGLTEELLNQREESARSLARDLHDDLGQRLSAAAYQVEHALQEGDGERRRLALQRSQEGVRAALDWVRDFAASLRPAMLDDIGLEAAVRGTLEDFRAAANGMQLEASVALRDQAVPEPVRSHVYRILNESLTNVLRHAGARRVEVRLLQENGHLELLVADDGRGFDLKAVQRSRGGLGLVGMRERAKTLRGRCEIHSQPGVGTTIHVTIPVGPGSPTDQ